MFELAQIRNPKLLRMGVMTASLKEEGTVPEAREEFKKIVMNGLKHVSRILKRMEGLRVRVKVRSKGRVCESQRSESK